MENRASWPGVGQDLGTSGRKNRPGSEPGTAARRFHWPWPGITPLSTPSGLPSHCCCPASRSAEPGPAMPALGLSASSANLRGASPACWLSSLRDAAISCRERATSSARCSRSLTTQAKVRSENFSPVALCRRLKSEGFMHAAPRLDGTRVVRRSPYFRSFARLLGGTDKEGARPVQSTPGKAGGSLPKGSRCAKASKSLLAHRLPWPVRLSGSIRRQGTGVPSRAANRRLTAP